MSKPVTGPMIAQVGTISATHDETIGRIIAERTFSWQRTPSCMTQIAIPRHRHDGRASPKAAAKLLALLNQYSAKERKN